jgi:hypothetical protein
MPPVYFAIGAHDDCEFFTVLAGGENRPDADQLRLALMARLARHRPPLVIHDELALARPCEALWPGLKTASIRAQIEAERGA